MDDDLSPSARRRERVRRSLRFRECQLRRRNWVGLYDIADWIACERGATDRRDEILRAQAYRDLLNAALAGEFECRGQCSILYFDTHAGPGPGSLRLCRRGEACREQLESWLFLEGGWATVVDQVLPRCWIPRDLAQRWFQRRVIPWPPMFDPAGEAPTRASPSSKDSSKRRRGPTPGAVDRYGNSDRALFPTIAALMRSEKISLTAATQRLADQGKVAGGGTPKSRAARLAKRYTKKNSI